MIDPTERMKTQDEWFLANPFTLTNRWEEYTFPIDVILKPTSYPGSSNNGWQTIDIAFGKNPTNAGPDPVWFTLAAGRSARLPCGKYWLRSSISTPNPVNVVVFPALYESPLALTRSKPFAPVAVGVGAASTQLFPARLGRSFLYVKNVTAMLMSLGFGVAASLSSGISISAGESVTLTDGDCPETAVNIVGTTSGQQADAQEA